MTNTKIAAINHIPGYVAVECPADYDAAALTHEDAVHDNMVRLFSTYEEIKVEAGSPGTEDYDYGHVIWIDGDQAEVAWKGSETRTTQSLSLLRVRE